MKKLRTRLDIRNDDGAVLVVALAFLLLLALFIPALLGTTSTSLSVSSTVSEQREQLNAAEVGLRSRVEALRRSRTAAVFGASCGPEAVGTYNGYDVRVQCTPQPSSGESGLTRPPYALLALPTPGSAAEGVADSPTNGSGGGTSDVYVGGKVASNGIVRRVANSASGHFYIAGTAQGRSCVGTNIDNPDTGQEDICQVVSTVFTDPGVTNNAYDRVGGFPSSVNPAATCLPNASRFSPGYYTSMPTTPCGASLPWWFSPGSYYFDFLGSGSHTLDFDGRTVVAGTPAPTNFDPNTAGSGPSLPGACKVDGDLPPYDGTEFIFGGDTTMNTGDGDVEICPTVSFTTQQISLRGYGAGGEASPGITTVPRLATQNSLNPSGGYITPSGAYNPADATAAVATVPANSSRTITVRSFPAMPANASIEKVLVKVRHQETSIASVASLAMTATYADGSTTVMPLGCQTGELCSSGAIEDDELDITADFMKAQSTSVQSVTLAFRVQSASGIGTIEQLHGLSLEVTYAPPGDFRRQTGCAVIPISANDQCDTLTNAVNGSLYVQGTVYAPLGRVNITTATGDPVQFNRGVIARDIAGAIHPGNGSANPFGLGRPERLALLIAEVLEDSNWVPRIESLVRFNDNIAVGTTRGRATTISWRARR